MTEAAALTMVSPAASGEKGGIGGNEGEGGIEGGGADGGGRLGGGGGGEGWGGGGGAEGGGGGWICTTKGGGGERDGMGGSGGGDSPALSSSIVSRTPIAPPSATRKIQPTQRVHLKIKRGV